MTPRRLPTAFVLLVLLAAEPPAAVVAQTPAAGAAAPAAADPDFVKAVERIRALAPDLADGYEKLNLELIGLAPDTITDPSKLPDVPAPAIAEYNRRLHALSDRADQVATDRKLSSEEVMSDFNSVYNYVWWRVMRLCVKNAPAHFKEISKKLSELEARTTALEGDAAAAAGATSDVKPLRDRLSALNADGTSVWNLLHADALNVDDLGNPMSAAPARKSVAKKYELNATGLIGIQANPLQARVADLATRLRGLDAILNGSRPRLGADVERKQSEALSGRVNPLLYDPFAKAEAASPGGAMNAGSRAVASSGAALITVAASKKMLLDLSRVPALTAATSAPGAPLPPVFTGAEGRDAAPAETRAVDALRARGATVTIGDPIGRARYAYHQTGGTCGIGAQVEVLADAGEVAADPEKLRAKEDELYARALALGYVGGSAADPARRDRGGTDIQYIGDLLDRPVRKRYAASDDELFKAASTGRMVIVITDGERLWNNPDYRGVGHIVAITGVEVNRATGKPLGYYINDTGTGEGGRFVAASQFLRSWRSFGSTLVEPL